jgi:hypothetical protein
MKKICFLVLILLVLSCSNEPVDFSPAPGASTLIFPENNQECNEGVDGPGADQSTVTFRWTASVNTDSYTLVLKNLITQSTSSHASETNELSIPILKGTPYSWYVVSENDDMEQTAQSATWKFYNAGEPVEYYAPFPASLIAPDTGSTLTGVTDQTLSWEGADIDDDIASFDVYFDTVSPPLSLEGNTTMTSLSVSVSGGNTYYWRIITHDDQGNNSQSEIFEFRVE